MLPTVSSRPMMPAGRRCTNASRRVCALILLLLLVTPAAGSAQSAPAGPTPAFVNLTAEDRAWLSRHREIRLGVDPRARRWNSSTSCTRTRASARITCAGSTTCSGSTCNRPPMSIGPRPCR